MSVKIGDTVVIPEYGGMTLKFDDEEFKKNVITLDKNRIEEYKIQSKTVIFCSQSPNFASSGTKFSATKTSLAASRTSK